MSVCSRELMLVKLRIVQYDVQLQAALLFALKQISDNAADFSHVSKCLLASDRSPN